MQRIFDSQKTAFRLRPSTTASERIALLDNLKTVLIKYQDQIAIAIAEDFGKELTEKMNISVDFTPWFYVAVVAFLAAAFFCYKRMSSMRS